MNPGPLLFLAAFFAMAASWCGFVLAPQLQMGRQQQQEVKETGALYPALRPGLARQGAEVYRANGCFYCHTEQVRPKGFGADFEHKWGARQSPVQSVAQDYLYDRPVMLGTQRVGPDLANIGARQTNSYWLLVHLYEPRQVSHDSTMPPFRYLFEKRKMQGDSLSPEAVTKASGTPGYEVVPTADAKALVAYLLSLHATDLVAETPPFPNVKLKTPPAAATNSTPAAATTVTNSPGPATNSPGK